MKKSRRAGRREASIISCRVMLQSSTSVSPLFNYLAPSENAD